VNQTRPLPVVVCLPVFTSKLVMNAVETTVIAAESVVVAVNSTVFTTKLPVIPLVI
jgi:type III secretory pathway component EscT